MNTSKVQFTKSCDFEFDYNDIPEENRERLAAGTLDFIKGLMNNPETKKILDARIAAKKAVKAVK